MRRWLRPQTLKRMGLADLDGALASPDKDKPVQCAIAPHRKSQARTELTKNCCRWTSRRSSRKSSECRARGGFVLSRTRIDEHLIEVTTGSALIRKCLPAWLEPGSRKKSVDVWARTTSSV